MTRPIRDPKSGSGLHPGRYYPGSELAWGAWRVHPRPANRAKGCGRLSSLLPGTATRYTVPEDVERAVKADTGLLDGGDPEISRFFNRGGKLLMCHGWADPVVSPDTGVIMFNRINRTVGSRAASSLALFMVPVWKDLRAVLPPGTR